MSLYFKAVKDKLKPNSIILYDDKKGKDESWEAYYINEYLEPEFEAYGASEYEAIYNLRKVMENRIAKVTSYIKILDSGNTITI